MWLRVCLPGTERKKEDEENAIFGTPGSVCKRPFYLVKVGLLDVNHS